MQDDILIIKIYLACIKPVSDTYLIHTYIGMDLIWT
jgi:hypothetical protein